MKKFETPIAEIEKFDIADVITTSTECMGYDPDCGSDTSTDWDE